jgi:hypothetical protein
MQILLLNQRWFSNELRSLGHTVLSCGMRPPVDYLIQTPTIQLDELLTTLPSGFNPDAIIWLDNSRPNTFLGIEDSPIPCLFYSIDTHHHFMRHASSASGFDHVFVAQADLLPHFDKTGTPTSWLPLWASEAIETSDNKRFGVVFVGTLNPKLNPTRVDFFNRLKLLTEIDVLEGHFPTIFPHSQLIINQTVKGDLNFRVFEALMSGAPLLTERNQNGLLDLFKDGTHLFTYTPNDPQDAAQRIKEILADSNHARDVGLAGRAEVLAKHTALNRALEIDRILRGIKKRNPTAQRYFGAMNNLLALSFISEESNRALSQQTSTLAIEALESALNNGAIPNETNLQRIVMACLRHDIIAPGDGIGGRIITRVADTFPDSENLSLLKIRQLLNTGRVAQARELALAINKARGGVNQTLAPAELDKLARDTFSAAESLAQGILGKIMI